MLFAQSLEASRARHATSKVEQAAVHKHVALGGVASILFAGPSASSLLCPAMHYAGMTVFSNATVCNQCITTVQRDADAATQEQCARSYVLASISWI